MLEANAYYPAAQDPAKGYTRRTPLSGRSPRGSCAAKARGTGATPREGHDGRGDAT